MTQTEIFIVLQTLWDFFLIILACGITCYWWVFWLLVYNDEPLSTENMDIITANLVIYGVFGICLYLITRHHNRKMDETWAKWDKKWEERSNLSDE